MKRRKKSRLFGDLKAGLREVLEIERGNIEPVSGGQIKKAVFIDRLFLSELLGYCGVYGCVLPAFVAALEGFVVF